MPYVSGGYAAFRYLFAEGLKYPDFRGPMDPSNGPLWKCEGYDYKYSSDQRIDSFTLDDDITSSADSTILSLRLTVQGGSQIGYFFYNPVLGVFTDTGDGFDRQFGVVSGFAFLRFFNKSSFGIEYIDLDAKDGPRSLVSPMLRANAYLVCNSE